MSAEQVLFRSGSGLGLGSGSGFCVKSESTDQFLKWNWKIRLLVLMRPRTKKKYAEMGLDLGFCPILLLAYQVSEGFRYDVPVSFHI